MCYSLTVSLHEGTTTKYPLQSSCTIGRHSTCGVQLSSKFISRVHATLILMPPDLESDRSYYVIKDGHIMGEKSINGTWVNGEAIARLTKLKHQDVITFGTSEYPRAIFLDDCANNEPDSGTIEHERPS